MASAAQRGTHIAPEREADSSDAVRGAAAAPSDAPDRDLGDRLSEISLEEGRLDAPTRTAEVAGEPEGVGHRLQTVGRGRVGARARDHIRPRCRHFRLC